MTPIVLTSKVGPDGVLHLTLPLTAADQEVRVTVEPVAATKEMTPGETKEVGETKGVGSRIRFVVS